MKKEELLHTLNELIAPIVVNLGYELYYIDYIKEEGENYLRVYIDKENGISLEDCEKVSRPVSDLLDEKDPIEESYYLEVSSPGMFRELYTDTHLQKYENFIVKVKLKSNYEGKKTLKGILRKFDNNSIIIDLENENIEIPREKVMSVNLEGSLKEVSTNE